MLRTYHLWVKQYKCYFAAVLTPRRQHGKTIETMGCEVKGCYIPDTMIHVSLSLFIIDLVSIIIFLYSRKMRFIIIIIITIIIIIIIIKKKRTLFQITDSNPYSTNEGWKKYLVFTGPLTLSISLASILTLEPCQHFTCTMSKD